MIRPALGVLLALTLCTAAARAQQGGAKKPEPAPQKAADPCEVLRAQSREVSFLDTNGKPLKLPPERLAAMAVGVVLERERAYSFTLSVKGVAAEAHVEVKELPGKERNLLKQAAPGKWQ